MNPAIVIQAGIMGAKVIGRTATAAVTGTARGGNAVNNWLKEAMPPTENPLMQGAGKADFPPLNVKVPENLDRKIKLLENTSKALGTPDAFSMTRGIVDQINEGTFKVLIVGRFNTGKSALLNKLLGRDILEVGPVETTKKLAWLIYEEDKNKETAWYHDVTDTLHKISLEEVKEIPEDPPVYNVFALVNADILSHGTIFIDTPGLQASGDPAALTNEALKNADAVILVVDDAIMAQDEQLMMKLKKEGIADRLFVVMNKMDSFKDEDRNALIKDCRDSLSKLGILTHIFPLSHTNNLTFMDDDFLQFRKAIVDYIDNGLPGAREASVRQRVRNTAAYLRDLCEEAAQLGRQQDADKREAIKSGALTRMNRFEQDAKKAFQNQREILLLKQSVLDKWGAKFGGIKDEVAVLIKNANDPQLNSLNQFFASIQADINRFLVDEFQAAENQVHNNISGFFSGALPVPQQEGQMVVRVPVRLEKNLKIPSEFGTIGMLAYTFFTRTSKGFFAAIGSIPQLFLIFTLSPLINTLFDQLTKIGLSIGTAAFKTQLEKRINDQWPTVDKNVRQKIDGYFNALGEQVSRLGDEVIKAERSSLKGRMAKADTLNSGAVSELEQFQRQLDAITE